MKYYIQEDIIKSYNWLWHKGKGLTGLEAFHKDYKPGKENLEENKRRKLFPKLWYANNVQQVLEFARRYYWNHTLCYGINPREEIHKNERGYLRSAKDEDIKQVMSFYFDIDFIHKNPGNEDFGNLELLLTQMDEYLLDHDFKTPVRAFTGNGYHILFAVPTIMVEEHPDIKDRLKAFRDMIHEEFKKRLEEINARMDYTMDLSRLAKIYGTRKPYKGARLSRFYGEERVEDQQLADYLLSMNLETRIGTSNIIIPEELPSLFKELLDRDHQLMKLWEGQGKPEGSDISNTGYDYSIVKASIKHGITDFHDLAAILALRPKGAVQSSGKGGQYIKRTVLNALDREITISEMKR